MCLVRSTPRSRRIDKVRKAESEHLLCRDAVGGTCDTHALSCCRSCSFRHHDQLKRRCVDRLHAAEIDGDRRFLSQGVKQVLLEM